MTRQDLPSLLDNLIQQAFLDSDEEREDYSPATNDIRSTIIKQYGRTAETPAYVAVLRRAASKAQTMTIDPWVRGYRAAISDLAHELRVNLDA